MSFLDRNADDGARLDQLVARLDAIDERLSRLEARTEAPGDRTPEADEDLVRFGRRETDPVVATGATEESAAARLIAVQMALSGYSREETSKYLRTNFGERAAEIAMAAVDADS